MVLSTQAHIQNMANIYLMSCDCTKSNSTDKNKRVFDSAVHVSFQCTNAAEIIYILEVDCLDQELPSIPFWTNVDHCDANSLFFSLQCCITLKNVPFVLNGRKENNGKGKHVEKKNYRHSVALQF